MLGAHCVAWYVKVVALLWPLDKPFFWDAAVLLSLSGPCFLIGKVRPKHWPRGSFDSGCLPVSILKY